MELQAIGDGGRGEQIIPHPFPTDQSQLQMNSDDTSHSCNFSHLKCLSFLSPLSNQWRENTYLIYPKHLAQEGKNTLWRYPLFPIDMRIFSVSLLYACLLVAVIGF